MDRALLLKVAGIALVLVVIGGMTAYGIRQYQAVASDRTRLDIAVVEREQKVAELQAALSLSLEENAELTDSLRTEKKKNDSFASQIAKISGTVGKLEKLSETDPELLQKYSKVYFLNENYFPPKLTDIPSAYVNANAVRTPLSFHQEALPYLESMLDAAAEDGVDLEVISAYRSFGTQAALKSSYKTTYGAGANTFSADQGYSEHQLGTTVDLTTPSVGGTFTGFDKTEAFAWLQNNAQRYGFILSYPAGNAYYQYEPWHWRFVGRDLARDLKREGDTFYDRDQRELDVYLADIFD